MEFESRQFTVHKHFRHLFLKKQNSESNTNNAHLHMNTENVLWKYVFPSPCLGPKCAHLSPFLEPAPERHASVCHESIICADILHTYIYTCYIIFYCIHILNMMTAALCVVHFPTLMSSPSPIPAIEAAPSKQLCQPGVISALDI